MPSLNHTHKYERVKQGVNGRIIHCCRLPDCTHFLTPELIVGKLCVCWRCKNEFVITSEMKDFKRPYCDVHKKKKAVVETVAPSLDVDSLLDILGVKK